MNPSVRSIILKLEKNERRIAFLRRQQMLSAMAGLDLVLFALTDAWWFAPLAVFVVRAGSVEARRFRKTGRMHQTRRSIWRGETPEDIRARPLLNGWRP